ncbi:MAG TPA: ribokinase [Rectinemataceae bacterium]|nr:ribokinase [Rectinemataceae bacterium]
MNKPKIVVMGSFVADLMGRGPQIPVTGETVKGNFFKVGPGGKGGNQAVAAARAGGDVAMITKLGLDSFGDMAFANFTAEGIDTTHVFRSAEQPTGAALIMVSETSGKNSIMVIPGACGAMDSGEVVAAMRKLGEAKVLVLQLETNFEAFAASLETGKEMGMKTICNPAPAQAIPAEYYPLIDYLTPNETEASTLSGIPVIDTASAEKAARALQAKGSANIIITLGENGALVLDSGEKVTKVPPFAVDAIDTTGAGDSFNGAFALALAEGKALIEATVFASAAAALSVTRIGTAPAMPYRGEIDEFLGKAASR